MSSTTTQPAPSEAYESAVARDPAIAEGGEAVNSGTAAEAAPGMSFREFIHSPASDGHELWNGVLIPVAKTTREHGWQQAEMARIIGNHAAEQNLGTCGTETPFQVEYEDYDTEKPATGAWRPDVYFVAVPPEAFASSENEPRCPDLVVEIVSPTDKMGRVQHRATSWLANGVKRVWILADDALVLVYRPDRDKPDALGPSDALDGEAVLPGVSIPVVSLYPKRRRSAQDTPAEPS